MPRLPGAQDCGEGQRLEDKIRWGQMVFLQIYCTITNANNRTIKSSERWICCKVWCHFLEQPPWLRSRGWVHQEWHKFPVEIVFSCHEPKWNDRRILISESPGIGISQKKTEVWKSAVWGQLPSTDHVSEMTKCFKDTREFATKCSIARLSWRQLQCERGGEAPTASFEASEEHRVIDVPVDRIVFVCFLRMPKMPSVQLLCACSSTCTYQLEWPRV